MTRRWLVPLLIVQCLAHLFWLSPAVHSGQVAIPWMMRGGMRLFGDIWEQHAPGSSLVGALAQSLLPIDPALLIKLMNTALVLVLTVLIYHAATQISGKALAGIVAAGFWVWWEPVYGNIMLYFDTLMALCILLALLVYYKNPGQLSRRQIILIGLLMGLATLFKQHAWLALAIVGLWLLFTENKRSVLLFALAAMLIPVLQWAMLAAQGLLSDYVFWNWSFNLSGFMDGVPLDGGLFRKLLLSNIFVFPFALLALRRDQRRLLLLPLIWLATLSVLYPRFGEIHGMGHLPFTAIMSGIVLAGIWPQPIDPRSWDTPRIVLAGLAIGIGIGWLWTGAVTYIPTQLGPGAILAYDEFDDLVHTLKVNKQHDDTLFVLPETDSTPQLHPRADMMPPGTWIKGWRWYFRPDFVLPTLKRDWENKSPTWVVVFPEMISAGAPGILDLLQIVEARYQLQFTVDDIYGHGSAQVYRLPA